MEAFCLVTLCFGSLVTSLLVFIIVTFSEQGVSLTDSYIEECPPIVINGTAPCKIVGYHDGGLTAILLSFFITICIGTFCVCMIFYYKLGKINLNLPDDFDSKKECTICYDNFEEKRNIYLTECNHVFHVECLEEWKKFNQNCPCPNCRLSDVFVE